MDDGSINPFTIEPNIPYPHVIYPINEVFFQFSADEGKTIHLCSCNRTALLNYSRFIAMDVIDPTGILRLYKRFTPYGTIPSVESTLGLFIKNHGVDYKRAVSSASFADDICHICTRQLPLLKPQKRPPKKLGSLLWYLDYWYYHLGICPSNYTYLKDTCPNSIAVMIDEYQKSKIYYDEQYRIYLTQSRNGGKTDNDIEEIRGYYRASKKIKSTIKKLVQDDLYDAFMHRRLIG